MDCKMALWIVLVFVVLSGAQDLREQDATCSAEACYAVYFQRRSFLDSWRSCRERGGTLVTIRNADEAVLMEELFYGLGLAEDQGKMLFWIGLQRQPRQCSPTRPLRGFTWVTGDQDTLYTNWLRPEAAPGSTCSAPRCVVMSYGASHAAQSENFKWLDGPCTLPVDGFVCKFLYKGMCPSIVSEAGPATYTTPFNLVSTLLPYVPFGSVANVPCSEGSIPDPSILCMQREDGTIGWSKDGPYCPEEQQLHQLGLHELPGEESCDQDNGGCEHICVEEGEDYFCECDEGYALMEDRRSCTPMDPCESNPCQFDCTSDENKYICSCPEGYVLGSDSRSCHDVDECAESSCDQLCINFDGGYECQCLLGYHLDDGNCRDTDECATQEPCEHSCENTAGSYACHCHLGYSPSEEDPHICVDTDECQIADMCQQMCVNYIGGFECYCNEGYELNSDGINCHNLLEAGAAGEEPYPFLHTTLGPPPSNTWFEYSDEDTGDEDLLGAPTQETTSQHRTMLRKMTTTTHTTPPTRNTHVAVETSVELQEWTTQLPLTPKAIAITDTKLNLAASTERLPVHLSEEQAAADGPLPETDSPSSLDLASTPAPTRKQKSASTSTLSPPVDAPFPADSTRSQGRVTLGSHSGTSTPVAFTLAPEATSSRAPLSGSEGPQKAASKQDNRWLLVALLVPLCIFLVVMLALGIVYCTRCGAKAKPKSVTDCYRWITSKNPAPTTGKPRV